MIKFKFSILIFLFTITAIFFSFSCKKKTNNISIPSYISVDTIKMETSYGTQGSSAHAITDCWIYVNGDSVGVFETPFTIPVLANGKSKINIHAGIKKSASDTKRLIYPFVGVFNIEENLVAGEVTKITPVFKYRDVKFILMEDFDNTGIMFIDSEQSDTKMEYVSGPESLEGKSMLVTLNNTTQKFECTSSEQYILPKRSPVFLQVSFKCNSKFDFGLFALEPNEGNLAWTRKNVYTFNDSRNKWRTVFIDLDYDINKTKSNLFKLYFKAFHSNQDSAHETKIYLDNIKLISYKGL